MMNLGGHGDVYAFFKSLVWSTNLPDDADIHMYVILTLSQQ